MPLSANTTVLVAAVAGAVGGTLLLIVLLLCFCRRPQKKVPLPPKQELARYREHHINHVLESRPATWYDSALLPPPTSAFGGSKSSILLPPDSRGGSPFRRPSLNTSESPSDDLAHLSATIPMSPGLQLPNHSFAASSTSLSTAETDSPPPSAPPTGSLNDLPSLRQTRSASSSSHPRRSRPVSVGSYSSSALSRPSRSSRNTIRGAPHGPHSQVQIILPAPLAFSNDRLSVHENSSRHSVVDQWAPAAVRSQGAPIPKFQRRSFSSSEPRQSTSHSSLVPSRRSASVSASASASPSRSSSLSASPAPTPPPPTINYPPASRLSLPPPVPPLPQQWLSSSSGSPLAGIVEDAERRRPQEDAAESSSTTAKEWELPPRPVDRPPPPDGKRKLQKANRSNGR
ncbi:hypothetical protein R3P38DRAFT_2824494 [Favolaschia claudopus]|uniref:Uncharacterized protein n=1 Tax=Favolaschia claudopus TaxID=2862362 RepID=A0AAW0EI56_9AGAR